MRSVALLTLALGASAQQLAIYPCNSSFAPEVFTIGSDGTVKQGSNCVDIVNGNAAMAPCSSGSTTQQWKFNADGTVASVGDAGSCWNVNGGGTDSGTGIIMYACGSRPRHIAANDLFKPQSDGTILAQESGLCVSSAAPPPPPPVPCDDRCCLYNGAWQAATQSCTCNLPWGGPNCSALQVLPVPYPAQGYGVEPAVTSWGGNVVMGDDGLYHMYVAEMVNNCTLNDWGSNSQCTHAVSATIEGPYAKAGTAVGVWCHNPHVIRFMNGSQTMYALFHIGDGSGGNPRNCSSGDAAVDSMGTAVSSAPYTASGSTLHLASSPYGPFVPVQPQPPGCNNPAPMLHPNGTWYLLCNGFTLYSAASVLGPWTQVVQVRASSGTPIQGSYEDPFLYVDAQGRWKIIYHVYTTDVPDTCYNSTVSGQYFSPDGLTWYTAPFEPYTNLVQFTDGSTHTVSTRERPKMLFNSAGVPTHIVNGVCAATYCAPTPCVNCKYNYVTYTLIQPLVTAA